jgi:hypothetical protein
LGNHDFYFGSLAQVRSGVTQLCRAEPDLRYLTNESWMALTDRTAAREGDYLHSYVMMNDYKLIAELAPYNKVERWSLLKSLGDRAADHIREHLPEALAAREDVLLVTHVPPFRAACWYDGQISDDEWSPHFTCQAMGQAILEIMARCPERRLTVLCGHTHGGGQAQPLPNVVVHTGGALYGQPAIARVFEVR